MRGAARWTAACAFYLLLSVALWWHTWSGHPATSASCGCGDPALTMWFLEWPAFALRHGLAPWYSTASLAPRGMNLLANTGMLAIGVLMAPVTWLFGPIATLNVASTLAPALSATAMYAFTRRLTTRWLPPVVAGLLYGFSPFVIANLATGHLNLTMLPVPPLVALLLDDLFVRQRRSPTKAGLLLAGLLVLQFFLSTEMLVILVVSAVLAIVVVTAWAFVREREAFRRRRSHVLRGLGVCGLATGVLLVVPVLYAVDGPGHLSGRIWSGVAQFDSYLPRNFFFSSRSEAGWVDSLRLQGYFGSPLAAEVFLSPGVIAVSVASVATWWRIGWVRVSALLAVVTGALSLGVSSGWAAPWRWFVNVPVLENVIQDRFIVITWFSLATIVAISADRCATWVASRRVSRPASPARSAILPALTMGAVCGLAVIPLAGAIVPTLPYQTSAVPMPRWFATAGLAASRQQVLLVYPAFGGVQSPLAWQAMDRMSFTMVNGSGPESEIARAGPETPGEEVLGSLTFALASAPSGTPAQLAAVRSALEGWGVSTVVVPNQVGPVLIGQGRSAPYAAAFFTAVLGRLPEYVEDAWVWPNVRESPGTLRLGARTLVGCWAAAIDEPGQPEAAPRCVMGGVPLEAAPAS